MSIEEFLVFEKENNLFDCEIDGFMYWHYIRFNVFQEIVKQKKPIGCRHTTLEKEKYVKRVYLKLRQIPSFIFHNPIWFLKEKDLIVFNHSRRVKNGDFYECLYTDRVLNELEYTYYVFEKPILERHYKPIKTKNIRYLDYIGFKVAIFKEFMKKLIGFRLPENEIKVIEELVAKLNTFLEVNLDKKYIIDMIVTSLLNYRGSQKYYKKIFDKVKPKMIIELVSYGSDKILINDIAKKRNIPIIELQHGIMGNHHVGYNFAEKVDVSTFPDYVFLFGQFWKDNTRLPIEQSRIKVVGWPYYEQKINVFKRINKKENKKTVILFISQGTIGKELSKIAIDLSKKINADKYKIIYKLHPGEYDRWQDEYPWLIQSDVEVIDKNEHDIHYFFAMSDVQIGVYSTAIYEGMGYGLKTLICKLYGHEFMEPLYNDNNYAVLFESTDELLNNLESEPETMIGKDIFYFWEEKSINNINYALKEIVASLKERKV